MLKMARMLLAGDEVGQDRKSAEEWAGKAVAELTPLAENGLAEAQRALADCYVSGLGVKKSIEEAVKLYVEAYEGRDWLAAGRLARFYASGKGVEQDLDKARELLQKAADRNDGEAEGLLGECYENGAWGFPRDVQKAFEWYRRSASEGDACGLFNVGRCYESGIGVEQDHGKAEMWLRLAAAEKGEYWGYDLKAAELLDELKGKSKKGRKNATKTHKPCKVGTAKKRKGRSHA